MSDLSPPSSKPRAPKAVDIHVAGRLRLLRTQQKFSQERLGDALGVTFQQIQKYERGANRIGASRLYDIAQTFGVTVAYFFEGLDDHADIEVTAANALNRLIARRRGPDIIEIAASLNDAQLKSLCTVGQVIGEATA